MGNLLGIAVTCTFSGFEDGDSRSSEFGPLIFRDLHEGLAYIYAAVWVGLETYDSANVGLGSLFTILAETNRTWSSITYGGPQ